MRGGKSWFDHNRFRQTLQKILEGGDELPPESFGAFFDQEHLCLVTIWSLDTTLVGFFLVDIDNETESLPFGLAEGLYRNVQVIKNLALEVHSHQLPMVYLIVKDPQDKRWEQIYSGPRFNTGDCVLKLMAAHEEAWEPALSILLPPVTGGIYGYLTSPPPEVLAEQLEQTVPRDLGSLREPFVRLLQQAVIHPWKNDQELKDFLLQGLEELIEEQGVDLR